MMFAARMMYLRYDAMSVSFMRINAHHLRSRHHCISNIIREQSEMDIIKKAPMLSHRSFFLEAPPGFEPGNRGFAVHCLTTWLWRHIGAGDEARTRYLHLGKVALYRMSYARIQESRSTLTRFLVVPPVGVEPTTRGFSIHCSTN